MSSRSLNQKGFTFTASRLTASGIESVVRLKFGKLHKHQPIAGTLRSMKVGTQMEFRIHKTYMGVSKHAYGDGSNYFLVWMSNKGDLTNLVEDFAKADEATNWLRRNAMFAIPLKGKVNLSNTHELFADA